MQPHPSKNVNSSPARPRVPSLENKTTHAITQANPPLNLPIRTHLKSGNYWDCVNRCTTQMGAAMSRVHVIIAASILLLGVLAISCVAHAESLQSTPTPTQTVPAPASATGSSSLPVHFWITNQALSQTVKAVPMTLLLDGQVIFDQSMEVGDQHNVAVVNRNLAGGSHTLTVKVGEPYNLSTDAVLDISGEQWIIAAFWFTARPENVQERVHHITVDVFDTPPAIQ